MLKVIITIMISIFGLFPYNLFSCTVITKSDNQKVLVGMNVDWMIPCFAKHFFRNQRFVRCMFQQAVFAAGR